MAKPTKQTSAATPAPTPPAPEASGAPSPELSSQIEPPTPDAQEPSLASLAEEEAQAETPPAPEASAATPAPTPVPSPVAEEAPREPIPAEDESVEALEARMQELAAKIAAKKPAPVKVAPPTPAMSSKIAEAQRFGVLATWKGPGTYGGTYYTLKGERMSSASGLTVGYFSLACIRKFPDQFSIQEN